MRDYRNNRRIMMMARMLRLMADALENVREPRELRGIALSLENVMSLLNLCLYSYQKHLIQNTQFGFDPTEVQS